MLKHSRGGARIPPARLSHISFHAQTFSLRFARCDTARGTICVRGGREATRLKNIYILVSQCDKGTVPLSHWLTTFEFSGFAFADSNGGESGIAANT